MFWQQLFSPCFVLSCTMLVGLDYVASQSQIVCCTPPEARQHMEAWRSFWLATGTQAKVDLSTAIFEELKDLSPSFGKIMSAEGTCEAETKARYVRFAGDVRDMANMLLEPETLWHQASFLRQRRDDWGAGTPEDFMALAEAITNILIQISPEFDLSSTEPCVQRIGDTLAQVGEKVNLHADCLISPDSGVPTQKISGRITFSQRGNGGLTLIGVDLDGFDSDDGQLKHGFHIHTFGELGNNCKDAGGHYNPYELSHGSPMDMARHFGDLGNVEEDANGTIRTSLIDNQASLVGPFNIIGRSIVVHGVEDDLGQGGFADSQTTGHAGARLGCCRIKKIDKLY